MTIDTIADEVMGRPYHRLVIRDPEGTYSASVMEFDGCFAGGDTPEDASTNLDAAMRLWVEAELEQRHDIPEPYGSREYSGRLNLRMPASLHEGAARRAGIEGVSLNQLLVAAVSQYLGHLRPATQRDSLLAASWALARAADDPAVLHISDLPAGWPFAPGAMLRWDDLAGPGEKIEDVGKFWDSAAGSIESAGSS